MTEPIHWPPDPALTAAAPVLRELQYARKFAIKQGLRAELAARALIRRALGWRPDLPEREAKQINSTATAIYRALRKGEAHSHPVAAQLALDIAAFAAAVAPMEARRADIEAEMYGLIAGTRLWQDFASGVRGLGARGLAVIIGEAGDPANYANPDKLKRRLCAAPVFGRAGSTWRVPSWRERPLTAEEWTEAGYSGARYAQLYGVVLESLMKAQSARVDSETGEVLREAGPYRRVYDDARAAFAPRAARAMHAHRHAIRVMGQQLIIDIWRARRGLPPRHRDGASAPAGGQTPADNHPDYAPGDLIEAA